MIALKRIFRVSEWFGSKLPLHIAVFLIFASIAGYNAKTLAAEFILYIAYVATYYSISYLANDLSDVEDDRRSGKRNAFQTSSIKVGIAVFVIISLVHFILAFLINKSWQFMAFATVGYLFGIFYSFKPFRFKERGVMGLIVASFFQRNFQLLVIPFFFVVDMVSFSLINVGFFVYGIRFILIHQYIDFDNDKVSGTKTFVGSAKNKTKYIIYICLAIELALILVAFSYILFPISPIYFGLLVTGYVLEVTIWWLMKINKQKDIFTSYFYVPMNFVYLFVLPAIACAVIVCVDLRIFFWGTIYFLCLVFAFYRTLKFHFEYFVASIQRVKVCLNYKRLWNRTIVKRGLRFLNVEPIGEDICLEESSCNYVVISPAKVKINIADLKPYLFLHECVELRYSPPDDINKRIDNERKFFQTQNDDMRSYFAIYIFNAKMFDKCLRKTIHKSIISTSACCDVIVAKDVELNSLHVTPSRVLEKEYASFSGLACSELYQRRADCFMKVFPFSSFFNLVFVILGILGYFFTNTLLYFSIGALLLNILTCSIIHIVRIHNNKICINWFIRFNLACFCFKANKSRVPINMVYGINTNVIVNKANYERIKAAFLIFDIIASLITTLLILQYTV